MKNTDCEHENVQSLPRHRHLYPDLSHDEAYGKLLGKVRRLVKSHGPDKTMAINGRLGSEHADAVMLESFVYGSVSGRCLPDSLVYSRRMGMVPHLFEQPAGPRPFIAEIRYNPPGPPRRHKSVPNGLKPPFHKS